MWHAFSLRTRILLSYGIGLLIMTILIIGLIFWLYSTREQLRQLNNTVALEAQMGAKMAAKTAQVEQAVNLYLQQPDESKRASIESLVQALLNDIQHQQSLSQEASYQQQLSTLSKALQQYNGTVTSMVKLLDHQKDLRYTSTLITFESAQNINQILSAMLNSPSAMNIGSLILVQNELQTANMALNRSVAEQDAQTALNSVASYELVRTRLALLSVPEEARGTLQKGIVSVSQAISVTQELATNLTELQSVRTSQLGEQAQILQKSADSIAENALTSFTQRTDQLEGQAFLAQQVIGVALLGTLLLALLIGLQLARTLTRPLEALVAAIQHVNQGNYDQTLTVKDRGELGSLIAAFNTMTATLRDQRQEVMTQQQALEVHNAELATTLSQLQESTNQREQLASTIRSMSVPIIPILDRVIVIPLIGDLDEERAQIMEQRLLAGIVAHRARTVILDITGLVLSDVSAVMWLQDTAKAASLLGSRTLLVGTHPEVAQALVAGASDLSDLIPVADLRTAIQRVLPSKS